ncbi:MAG: peroxiredoxin [Ferruginibacter sp.]|nr:peroxiredoxin [Ferruginibacter sp.]
MKYFIVCVFFACLFSFKQLIEIYNISINTIEGNKIELNEYRGKKILFVVLPLSADDATISAGALKDLQKRHDSCLVIIGIVSEENGFKKGNEKKVRDLYRGSNSGFLITEGLIMKNSSAREQSVLFQWLTTRDNNHQFNSDARGAGQKFFVNETGDLYAVIGAGVKLCDPVVERMLTLPSTRMQKQ